MNGKNDCGHFPCFLMIPVRENEKQRKKSDDAHMLQSPRPALILLHDEVVGLENEVSEQVSGYEFKEDHGA